MVSKTQVIFNEEVIADVNGTLPLVVGERCYFSVREFYPKAEREYRGKSNFPKQLQDSYLESVKEKCDKFHIKEFVVTSVSRSLDENYNNGLLDDDKLHEFVTCITVEEFDEKEKEKKRLNKFKNIHVSLLFVSLLLFWVFLSCLHLFIDI